MSARPNPPFVLIPCDNRLLGGHMYHALGHKYADAVTWAAQCLPLLAPTGGAAADVTAYLELVDGILLPGSPANVHPSLFGQPVRDPSLPLDEARDAVTLPLVRLAVERGIPLLAICRGLQEINVAMGGTLHQAVHELADKSDHRGRADADAAAQYGPAHQVDVVIGSALEHIVGERHFTVNSVHGQGIDVLAPGLTAEAWSHDGLIEAVRITSHPGFSLAVQWHPEWKVLDNPVSMKIFRAFGDACRAAHQHRRSTAAQAARLPRAA